MSECPSVRRIEAAPVEVDGQRMVSLNDPDRLADQNLMVSLPAFFLMTLMDGSRSVGCICDEFFSQFRQRVSAEEVNGLVSRLDEALLLDNDRSRSARDSIREEFFSRPDRAAVFAGKSYPEDEAELGRMVDEMLSRPCPGDAGRVRAIVVPHIDFSVGADMMAAGWRRAFATGAELYVILGVGHTLSADFFACIDKDFTTPLGPMRVDRGFMEALEKNFGEPVYGQAEAHRNEHSIEFQSLFMARAGGARPGLRAAPVLLSFPEMVWDVDHPLFNGDRVDRFIDAIGKTVAEDGRRAVYVASVDFSHVGARFGDSESLTEADLGRIEKDDRELLSAIAEGDAEGFMKTIRAKNEANRVCGFPALYALMRLLGPVEGELVEYRQNLEGGMETVVSFATMILKNRKR